MRVTNHSAVSWGWAVSDKGYVDFAFSYILSFWFSFYVILFTSAALFSSIIKVKSPALTPEICEKAFVKVILGEMCLELMRRLLCKAPVHVLPLLLKWYEPVSLWR